MLLVTVPLLALVLSGLVVHTGGRHIDLEVYRLGVQAWLSGGDLYGPLPETSAHIALPFIYPPFAALLMVPWALMSWTAAWVSLLALSDARRSAPRCTWWPGGCGRPAGRARALSVASIALPLALAVQPGKAIDFAATVPDPRGPPLGLEPVLQTIEFGQINLLLMALVVLDCLVERPRWPRGLLIGIAAAIKLTPAVFLLYLLLRRDFRAAVTTVVAGAVATLLGFLVAPAESWRFWLDNPVSGVSGSPFFTNQTFQAVLVRAGVDGAGRPDRLAAAVRGAARAGRAGHPAGAGPAGPGRHGRGRAAGLADLVVAPLGLGGARAAGGGGHGLAGALPRLAGGHGGDGRGVRDRPAPVGAAPGRRARADLDPAAAGVGQHLRVVHGAAVRAALAGLAEARPEEAVG